MKTANGWDKESIQNLLETNDKAVFRALVQIYNRQTLSEQAMETTTDANGVGFSAFDAEVLTDIAKRAIKYNGLTPKQTALVRRRIKKYWKQLLEIAATSPVQPKATVH